MQSESKNKISFKSLESKDLNLVLSWLENDHVKEFWVEDGNHEEIYLKYKEKINSDVVFPFIIKVNGKPIGYIQYYFANKVKNVEEKDLRPVKENFVNDKTVGFDIFIGEPSSLGKGLGHLIVEEFVKLIFETTKCKKIICDPMIKNSRAIRCYQKVGFEPLVKFDNNEGNLLLMGLTKTAYKANRFLKEIPYSYLNDHFKNAIKQR